MDENRKGAPRAMDTFVLVFCRLVTLPEGSPVFRELAFSPVVTVMHRGGTNSGGPQEVGIQSVHGGRCSGESGLTLDLDIISSILGRISLTRAQQKLLDSLSGGIMSDWNLQFLA